MELLINEVTKNDTLRQWEKQRRSEAERTILTAARIISPVIGNDSDGYTWCVDAIKQSIYAELSTDLEINKAIQYLRNGNLSSARQILISFDNNKDSKVASAAANNLAFLNLLVCKCHLQCNSFDFSKVNTKNRSNMQKKH